MSVDFFFRNFSLLEKQDLPVKLFNKYIFKQMIDNLYEIVYPPSFSPFLKE